MTAGEREFTTLLDEGDYFEALGLPVNATAMDIHTAAARRAAELPDLALRISAIGSVLRDETQREVYLIAREERDAILSRGLEPRLRAALPDLRTLVWEELQRLLRCDFDLPEVKIGPRGARSLASRHEWIREAVINAAFPVLCATPSERQSGGAYRRLSRVTACVACGGTLAEDCDCNDTFLFDIPTGAAPGALLGAYGERTGRYDCMILDQAVVTPRPDTALRTLYGFWVLGVDGGQDLTLEEAEAISRRSMRTFFIGYIVMGGLLGLPVGSWAAGVLATLVGCCFAVATRGHRRWQRVWLQFPALLVVQSSVGAFAGYVSATVTSGLLAGAIPSVLPVLLAIVSRRHIRT